MLPAKLVGDIVRALAAGHGRRSRSRTTRRAIAAGRSQFTVRTIPADEFPRLRRAGGRGRHARATDFAEALRQVVAAASTDETRPILTGVLMAAEAAGLRLVATDSYRLAVRDLPGTSVLAEGQSVLVPSTRAEGAAAGCSAAPSEVTPAPRRARRHVRGRAPTGSPPG